MQYSPNNSVFTISLVDAGTVDLLRGLGKNIVSSADLVAQFESTWTGGAKSCRISPRVIASTRLWPLHSKR